MLDVTNPMTWHEVAHGSVFTVLLCEGVTTHGSQRRERVDAPVGAAFQKVVHLFKWTALAVGATFASGATTLTRTASHAGLFM